MTPMGQVGNVHDYETEALVAELIERVELHGNRAARFEQEVERLRAEQELLQAELELATRLVTELSGQLVAAGTRLENASSLGMRIRARSTPG